MKVNSVLGAALAVIISTGTAVIALLTQEGVAQLSDIGQVAWIVIGIGAAISFAKDLQALDTRKAIGKITGNGGG